MGDVETTCDRIIVLEGGAVTEAGDVSGFTAESETVYIDVYDDVDSLIAALSAHGLEASLDGVSVAVEGVGDSEYDQIRDALVDAGSRLRRLGPRRRRLSDIFRDGSE